MPDFFLWFASIVCLQGAFLCEVCGVQSLSILNDWLLMFGCDFMRIPHITVSFLFFCLGSSFFYIQLNWSFSEKNIPEVPSNLELSFSWRPHTLPLFVYCVCEDCVTCRDSWGHSFKHHQVNVHKHLYNQSCLSVTSDMTLTSTRFLK